MVQLELKHQTIINNILSTYPYTFYVFGSRAKHTAKPLSDLDLCYKESIPLHVITVIREQLEEARLPFTVDIVDWNFCSKNFQKKIEADLQLFFKP